MKHNYKVYALIFSILLAIKAHADDMDKKQENYTYCAKIATRAIDDLFDLFKIKHTDDHSYILLSYNSDDINYITGDSRATIAGHMYIMNINILILDALSVITINNNIPTDTVTYMSNKNKVLGGLFHSEKQLTKIKKDGMSDNVAYIDNAGDTFHFIVNKTKDKECINHFPKNIQDRIIN